MTADFIDWKKIRYLILDVDGTMTDGGVYLDSQGNELKKFSIKDGAGILLARQGGIQVMILTGRESLCVTQRARELQIPYVFQNVKKKKEFLREFFRERQVGREEAAYIGDDLNDLGAMRLAGITACPRDAAEEVKKSCTLILKSRGGEGAVREFTERILEKQGILRQCKEALWGAGGGYPMKDWFYEKFVRKNPRVKKAYETYVQAHLEEHRQSRIKHWLVLLALSWKYRKSQISRLHTLTLVKQKDGRAKIRMEWIPGACCYNLYVSRDGVDYRFLEKTRRHIYTAEHLKQEQMYFFKYKVSMDGSRYSGFSEVLTVSTVTNEQLFFMKKLSQTGEMLFLFSGKVRGKRERDGKSKRRPGAPGKFSGGRPGQDPLDPGAGSAPL